MNTLPVRIAFLFSICSGNAAADAGAAVAGPAPGVPRAIGETNNGCIGGAVSLPGEGAGYLVMHLERRRYFGHPSLIGAIEALGRAAAKGIGSLQVGDLGLPRGGPMPFGHRSHQTGLDVDVWFNLDPKVYAGANGARSNIPAPSLLNSAKNSLDGRLWSNRHIQLLKAAAALPAVDRIFVNPHIKRELCRTVRTDRGWLHKIRPWYGHDDHFHMRLACPEGSPDCVRQEPVPAGEGCDAGLAWWFEPHPPEPAKPEASKPVLPAACRALLGGKG
jgi:penicillin-insensitive murein endopeptidase